MRKRWLGSVCMLLTGTSVSLAQTWTPPAPPEPVPARTAADVAVTPSVPAVTTVAPKSLLTDGVPVARSGETILSVKQTGEGQVLQSVPASQAAPRTLGPTWTPSQPIPGDACVSCPTNDEDDDDRRLFRMPLAHRFWVSADFLLWWMKPQSTNLPLLTTSTGVPVTNVGGLGQPDTFFMYGPGDVQDSQPFAGGKVEGGFLLNDRGTWAVESGFFVLGTRGGNTFFGSDGTGAPLMARPIFLVNSQEESSFIVSQPGVFSGSINFDASSRLLGGEFNVVRSVFDYQWLSVDLLGGFRFLELKDDFIITDATTTVGGGPGVLFINGNALDDGSVVSKTDEFHTKNRYYGGQIGLRTEARNGRWFMLLKSKVAFGSNNQQLDINGTSTATSPSGIVQNAQGGLYAVSSNIGNYSRNEFAVVPEVGVNLGYTVSSNMRVYVGYNFLYMSNVLRASDQIDRTINGDLVPTAPPGLNPSPLMVPRAVLRDTDFWTHGVNFGLAFRF